MAYDRTALPEQFDQGRSYTPEVLALWMSTLQSALGQRKIRNIVDLGCGTGRFTQALASTFDAPVTGIDPSKKMLEQAQQKKLDARITYKLGPEKLFHCPTRAATWFSCRWCFTTSEIPNKWLGSAGACCVPGGTICLRAATLERIDSYAYVPFFPTSRPILEQRMASVETIRRVFEAARFHTKLHRLVQQKLADNYAAYAERLSRGGDSILASLSRHDFEKGMEALRSYAEQSSGQQPVSEPIDFFAFV